MTPPRTFYIETYGCQMNKLDSHLVADKLLAMGLQRAESVRQAQVVLYVTCSVREHAEDRVYSNVGQLRRRKQGDPAGLIIGILGCMAEKDGEAIFRRLPHVDFVCGPAQLDRLEDLLRESLLRMETGAQALAEGSSTDSAGSAGGAHLAALDEWSAERAPGQIDDHLESFEEGRLTPVGEHPYHAYVRAMRGCDNFCAYCVVPMTRGPEASRPPSAILAEVRRLVEAGVRHVTLLGQSIGGYHREEDGRQWRLADLVQAAAATPSLVRLDFVTSHPKNLTPDIMAAMADGAPVVAPYLHVPAQSGSNKVLAAMKRGYTIEQYMDRVERARQLVPGLCVASDFIVGFPGETEADFEATLELIRRMQYSQVFAFKYSVRPGTAAAKLEDDVPEQEKTRRIQVLFAVQKEVGEASNARWVGQVVPCLVTGPSPKPHLDPGMPAAEGQVQLTSRSPGHQIVVFNGPQEMIGQLVQVEIVRSSALTLFGRMVG